MFDFQQFIFNLMLTWTEELDFITVREKAQSLTEGIFSTLDTLHVALPVPESQYPCINDMNRYSDLHLMKEEAEMQNIIRLMTEL